MPHRGSCCQRSFPTLRAGSQVASSRALESEAPALTVAPPRWVTSASRFAPNLGHAPSPREGGQQGCPTECTWPCLQSAQLRAGAKELWVLRSVSLMWEQSPDKLFRGLVGSCPVPSPVTLAVPRRAGLGCGESGWQVSQRPKGT